MSFASPTATKNANLVIFYRKANGSSKTRGFLLCPVAFVLTMKRL